MIDPAMTGSTPSTPTSTEPTPSSTTPSPAAGRSSRRAGRRQFPVLGPRASQVEYRSGDKQTPVGADAVQHDDRPGHDRIDAQHTDQHRADAELDDAEPRWGKGNDR